MEGYKKKRREGAVGREGIQWYFLSFFLCYKARLRERKERKSVSFSLFFPFNPHFPFLGLSGLE